MLQHYQISSAFCLDKLELEPTPLFLKVTSKLLQSKQEAGAGLKANYTRN